MDLEVAVVGLVYTLAVFEVMVVVGKYKDDTHSEWVRGAEDELELALVDSHVFDWMVGVDHLGSTRTQIDSKLQKGQNNVCSSSDSSLDCYSQ